MDALGFNLKSICWEHREHAYYKRGEEATGISLFLKRHGQCERVEWTVDNCQSTAPWDDEPDGAYPSELYLPDDLLQQTLAEPIVDRVSVLSPEHQQQEERMQEEETTFGTAPVETPDTLTGETEAPEPESEPQPETDAPAEPEAAPEDAPDESEEAPVAEPEDPADE